MKICSKEFASKYSRLHLLVTHCNCRDETFTEAPAECKATVSTRFSLPDIFSFFFQQMQVVWNCII